jgi:hypothetical protein
MMWVVGLEVQMMTCMGRFTLHFHNQFMTHLHDQDIQEQKIIISFKFYSEFDGRAEAVEVAKKQLQSCWSKWPDHESVVNISEPLSL